MNDIIYHEYQDTGETVHSRRNAAERRRRKHRRQLIGAAAGLIAFAAVTVGIVSLTHHAGNGTSSGGGTHGTQWQGWLFDHDGFGNPQNVEIPDWIVQDFLPLNDYSRPGTRLDSVNGVVVHYTGNPGTTAEQNRNYFANLAETHETSASSHFVIGIDGTIIQCIPLDEWAYCSSSRNCDTISIECCHSDESGEFSPETLSSLKKLLVWLINTYDLDEDDVIRHYDVTGKICPKYYVDNPDAWEELKEEVFLLASRSGE